MSPNTHILLVEDNRVFARALAEQIRRELGCRVDTLSRGDQAVARILKTPPDLLVLDVGLPGLSGFEVCRRVRGDFRGPILFLTAESEDKEQLKGFDMGADDYVCKPTALPVILARIRTLLRRFRQETEEDAPLLELGPLRLDRGLRRLWLHEKNVDLTDQEFDLLWALARREGKACSRDDLHLALFGKAWNGKCRQLDNLIRRLRVKLEETPEQSRWIRTLRHVGYMLQRQPGE
ncbi:MAG: response regulator transcription factor [Deltaproteobacteria bacterium]|nr:response regulator transcription factor [Deltaproteobacteria bacterium]